MPEDGTQEKTIAPKPRKKKEEQRNHKRLILVVLDPSIKVFFFFYDKQGLVLANMEIRGMGITKKKLQI